MPPNAAIRSWLRALAAVACVSTVQTVAAQYRGGPADGFSSTGIATARLDGTLLASPAYRSSQSGGDGYHGAGLTNITLDGNALISAVYASSSSGGDGYHSSGRVSLVLDGPALPAVVYTASLTGGDGYHAAGFVNLALNGAADFAASFTGGGGDGYDTFGLTEAPLDLNFAWQFVFSGGGGDGHDFRGLALSALDGSDADPSPYLSSGSGADGYDLRGLATTRLDGTLFPSEIFVAGTGGDGYDRSGASFLNLNGDAHFVLTFLGSQGDGFDSLGLRHTALDPSILPPDFVFSGSDGDGYDLELAPFVYYLGEDGAAAPMTWPVWRSITFTEQEAAAGLAADTADPDRDGLPNLLEYALGSDPHTDDSSIFAPLYRVSNLSDFGLPALPEKHLTAVVRRDPRIFDASLSVEVTNDLSLWDSSSLVPVNTPLPSLLIVRDSLNIEAPRRLMRLRATLDP